MRGYFMVVLNGIGKMRLTLILDIRRLCQMTKKLAFGTNALTACDS